MLKTSVIQWSVASTVFIVKSLNFVGLRPNEIYFSLPILPQIEIFDPVSSKQLNSILRILIETYGLLSIGMALYFENGLFDVNVLLTLFVVSETFGSVLSLNSSL